MRVRGMFSGFLAAGLTLTLMPLGCGGDAGSGQVDHAASPSLLSNDWTVPEAVMEKLRGCVTAHARDLQTYAHQAKFEARIDESGSVQGMRMRSSTLHHGEMESCMMRALVSLPVSMEEVLRYTRPVAESDSMGRERGALGIVQAVAGVALGPIIVIAVGVTLTVYVAVAVTEETLEAAKRRRKKIEEMCSDLRAC